ETPEGEPLPTEAGQLIEGLRSRQPRLVFLSACFSAATGRRGCELSGGKDVASSHGHVTHSLAEALVNAGLGAVVGWGGLVADVAATAFAARLYSALESREDLADAVAAARRALLSSSDDCQRRHWHLTRLWLGPQGGGPIVGGRQQRAMMPATHGRK